MVAETQLTEDAGQLRTRRYTGLISRGDGAGLATQDLACHGRTLTGNAKLEPGICESIAPLYEFALPAGGKCVSATTVSFMISLKSSGIEMFRDNG